MRPKLQLSSITRRLLDVTAKRDYLPVFLVATCPIVVAWLINAHESVNLGEGLYYIGYWHKMNLVALTPILPAALFALRWAMNRIAPVCHDWPATPPPAIVDILESDDDKQVVFEELRASILSPRNIIVAFVIVAAMHVGDMWVPVSVFVDHPTGDDVKELREKDGMYMYLIPPTDKDGKVNEQHVAKWKCGLLIACVYSLQFAVLLLTVLYLILILRHNLFFLRRIYQRRWVPAGKESQYLRIDLDDVNKCFGFRRANDAFNTQVLILVVWGTISLVSRFANVDLQGTGTWQDVLQDPMKLFPDVGQVLVAATFLTALAIVTLPTLVKLLPRVPVAGTERAYWSIVGYLREFLTDEDWQLGDEPSDAEIEALAGRFAENAFWPTGDNRARRLFHFCLWVFLVMLIPFYGGWLYFLAFLVVSGVLAYAATAFGFWGMKWSLAYIDERLVKLPEDGSPAKARKWHKRKLDISVFLSYRRSDSAAYAGRLCHSLAEHIGKDHVFMDIENIDAGSDFVDAIEDRLNKADAVIVLIGRTWASTSDNEGRVRLDDPKDFVRLEVATALKRDVKVLPVLVGDAQMPDEAELPDVLVPITRINALEISDTRWDYDVGRLVAALRKLVPKKRGDARKARS